MVDNMLAEPDFNAKSVGEAGRLLRNCPWIDHFIAMARDSINFDVNLGIVVVEQ